MDRGAWWATVQRVAQSQTRLKQLSKHAGTHTHTMEYYSAITKNEIMPFIKTEDEMAG